MAKTLVLAEKASVSKDFKLALEKYGKFTSIDRGYESEQYIITWAQGHVLSTKEMGEYENWGGSWELSALPWYPPNDTYDYQVPKGTAQIFKQIRTLLQRSDISLVVNACDAGREGDLIFWEIYDYLKLKTPVKRFWESVAMTPENIRRIMSTELKEEAFMLPRKQAAYARAHADLLLGMNFTVGFTSKAGALLHMGRVQTPTIALLVKRKQEMDRFIPEDYFEIQATFRNAAGSYPGLWFKTQLGNTRLKTKKEAEMLLAKIKGKTGTITQKEVKKQSVAPPLLYSLTTLQQHASRKFGYTAKRTLEIAQKLYETHKILSYPRSDSEYIGSDNVKKLPDILRAVRGDGYDVFTDYIIKNGVKTTSRMVNDKKLTDHHAIIPTEVTPNLSALSEEERNIYDLVARRFLAAFYPAALYEKTDIITVVEDETFKSSGKIEIDPGWKVVYGKEQDNDEETETKDDEETLLPPVEKGDSLGVEKEAVLEKKTKPPSPYNESTLLGVMKDPKKFLGNDDLKKAMASANDGQGAGLGTPATRDTIIENIIRRGYVARKGKQLVATELGEKLIAVCPEELTSPEITAEWEGKLRDIEEGKRDYAEFMTDIKSYIEKNLQHLRHTTLTVTFDRKQDEKTAFTCPKCQGEVVRRTTKKGIFYVCANATREAPCIFVGEKILGKQLTKTHIQQLFQQGKTGTIAGFKSTKKKTRFSAKLSWDLPNNRTKFLFAEKTQLRCPFCQGEVTESDLAFSCANSRTTNCGFAVWKNKSKKLNTAQVEKLIQQQQTDVVDDLVSKKGKTYKAYYLLNLQEKKVEMKFP